jgi:hypothetical protein
MWVFYLKIGKILVKSWKLLKQSGLLTTKVRYIIFFAGYAEDNLGVKKVLAASKNPKNSPLYICFAPHKKILSRTFKIRGTLVFLCLRERERERERARARKGKEKGKRKRRREREDKSASNFISKTPGPEWKIRELYCTVQERAV